MAYESVAFRVAGIEPRDPAFRTADEDARKAFWQAAVKWVEEEMDKQLAAGLDKHGEPLVPIAESTRAKGRWRSHTGMGDPDAPPLDPAYRLSRTRSLFDARAHWRERYILGFWRLDEVTGRHWGQILGYHRRGVSRPGRPFLPQRDVIGLSPAAVARVRERGEKWWRDYRAATERLSITLPPPSSRPIPERPKPAVAAVDRFRYATFGIGPSEAKVRQAEREGRLSGPRRLGFPPPTPPAPPGGMPARPKPPTAAPAPRVAASPRPLEVKRLQPVRPVAVRPIDLDIFAAQAKQAAATVGPEGRGPGGSLVFISHAHKAYERKYGPISLTRFKLYLGRAVTLRKLNLSRADLVEAMNELDLEASVFIHPMGAEFHFLRIDY